jgi:hypothetical protein
MLPLLTRRWEFKSSGGRLILAGRTGRWATADRITTLSEAEPYVLGRAASARSPPDAGFAADHLVAKSITSSILLVTVTSTGARSSR